MYKYPYYIKIVSDNFRLNILEKSQDTGGSG